MSLHMTDDYNHDALLRHAQVTYNPIMKFEYIAMSMEIHTIHPSGVMYGLLDDSQRLCSFIQCEMTYCQFSNSGSTQY